MKKYLFISVSYEKLKRGAYLISERMSETFNDYIDHLETNSITDINHLKKLNEQYRRIIFITQVQSNYSIPVNILSLRDINYLLYTRQHEKWMSTFSCNNGFYYSYPNNIVNYIPLITDFKVDRKLNFKRPCLGFYIRNYLTPDSYTYFVRMLSDIKQDIDIYIQWVNLMKIYLKNLIK